MMNDAPNDTTDVTTTWTDEDTQDFLDYGEYFVPERSLQLDIIRALVGSVLERRRLPKAATIADIGCGAGLLTEMLLEQFPTIRVLALDGSSRMLRETKKRVQRFGERVTFRQISLEDQSWLNIEMCTVWVSSLVIHHLDDKGKQELFCNIAHSTEPGGALVISDLIKPTAPVGFRIAADCWDIAVRANSEADEGNTRAFDRFKELRWNYFSDTDPDPVDKPSGLIEQLQWLASSGFEAVDVYWMKAGHAIFSGFKPDVK